MLNYSNDILSAEKKKKKTKKNVPIADNISYAFILR